MEKRLMKEAQISEMHIMMMMKKNKKKIINLTK